MYAWDGRASTLVEKATSERVGARGQVTTVAVSTDGGYIAAGDVRSFSFPFSLALPFLALFCFV